jgi:hypothetical protein
MVGLSLEPAKSKGPNFFNDEPLNIDPLRAGAGQLGTVREIESILGGNYCPLGEWLSYSSVYLEASGRVVDAGIGGWLWDMGSNLESALRLAMFAERPLVCLYTPPGIEPWPTLDDGI